MKEKLFLKHSHLKTFSAVSCMDCQTTSDLCLSGEEEDTFLCKHCLNDRLEEFQATEAKETQYDIADSLEDFRTEEHLEHFKKNA